MFEYKARLFYDGRNQPIYDADTIRLEVDAGFGLKFALGPCRLFGIDAPEVRGTEREAGIAARDYVRSIVPEKDWFLVRTHKDGKGKYGRYLVDIYLDVHGGVSLSDHLVEAGMAVHRDY